MNDKNHVLDSNFREKRLKPRDFSCDQSKASSLEQATTVCFFGHQETRLGPKNTQAPDVDLLSSGSEAQSAS